MVECKKVDKIDENDIIRIKHKEGIIQNLTKDEEYECTKIPDHLTEIVDNGGLVLHLKIQFQ